VGKKLVYGVGINDLGYPITKTEQGIRVWECPYYNKWIEMLRRGFSEAEKARHSTYKNTTVCDEWRTASVFKAWMEQQDWKGLDLDKDILLKGNNIYSPETTVFVPSYINTLLVTSSAIRGKWPLGVSFVKQNFLKGVSKVFRASIKDKRNLECIQKNLGHFTTQDEAHRTWQQAKYEVFLRRLDEYSKDPQFNQKAYDAIKIRAINLKLDIALGKETFNI
jgi:hypothetical protein